MNSRRRVVAARRMLLSTTLIIAGLGSPTRQAIASPPPQFNQNSAFLGQWCAQGDRSKQASITANGMSLTVTNEQGSSSIANYQGMDQNTIVAPQWQFVTGTISPDASRIIWSNGTFWARCNSGGGGGGGGNHGRLPNLQGTWYRDGNHSLACSIQQKSKSLTFTNESGQTARGSFLGNKNLTAKWGGQTINGTLVNNAGRINWDNGTMWSR